ncbi:antioxidant, AhpC/TSA family protein [Rhizoctonia solani AG-3 Rhs1AP]|uniref:thioredoxin-dependent peroxiredoxin n=1 Tax=Rhizoctonia solani AG-3 Rhs1AP TaxID=1086054 RepID=X8JHV1_9AGAM|nr:antioxidant, AhpC/TSA family protein [Rhizoctonia solani AG-3 Rhs1AP]
MSQTETWPGDSGGFRASVDILRPLFEEALSEVPFEMKEEAYLDWIHSHSKQGPRFVSSWTPSTLVNRANEFILGPLAYRSPASLTQESTPQAPLTDRLPEVPMEFVAQHGLQAAVDEGLLRIEVEADDTHIHDLGSNSASRLSAEDTRTQGAHVLFNHTPQHEDVWEKYYSSIQKSYTPHSHGVNTLPAADASVSLKALGIGDVLPSFTLLNQSGENVELGSLAKEKGVVIFVIPKANTPGCTTQACGFRDNYQYFTELGYVVYCLSHDSPKVQTSWQSKHTLPYPLLSDPKRTFINLLGAWVGGGTRRSHFVFEKGTGKLVERQIGVKPADSPKSALEFVKKHAEETRTWGTHVPLSHTPQYQNDSGIYNTNVQNFVPQFHGVGAPPTTSGNPMNFELATGNTYFALEEEFDSIPLIHFLTRRFDKTIIFLEGTMLEKYRNLFRSLMRQKVLMVKPGNFPKQAEEISLHFVQSSSPAVLLIEHTFSGLPDALKHQSIGCWLYCVHDLQWAYWVQDLKIQIAKIWQSQINYAMGAFIIPSSRKKSLAAAISGFPEHPQASLILSRNSPSLLESERNAVRSTLLSEGGTIRGLYSVSALILDEVPYSPVRKDAYSLSTRR